MVLLGTSGCSPAGVAPHFASVAYEAGECFGACPVYRVTVNADGSALFHGRRATAVEGERRFRIEPERYRALVTHLERVRPARGSIRYDGDACDVYMTDDASTVVSWRSSSGEEQQLYLYHGCDPQRHQALREQLAAVPALLGISDWIVPG